MSFPPLSLRILPIFFFIIIILLQYHSTPCLTARTLRINNNGGEDENPNTYFIRESCNATMYPELCYSTFSNFSDQITETNPKRELACFALHMTLSEAQGALVMSKSISKGNSTTKGKRQGYARKDCMEVLKDSLDELRMSVDEMDRANPEEFDFRFRVNNVQTWVSAALTDEDTCMDELKEGWGNYNSTKNFKRVRDEVIRVAHLTSIALALINNYAASC